MTGTKRGSGTSTGAVVGITGPPVAVPARGVRCGPMVVVTGLGLTGIITGLGLIGIGNGPIKPVTGLGLTGTVTGLGLTGRGATGVKPGMVGNCVTVVGR